MTSQRVLLVPSQVTNVSLSKGSAQGKPGLSVTWTAPQSDTNITKYQVQYKKNDSTSWDNRKVVTVSSTPTTSLLSELDPGTVYNVRVRAVSASGNGSWSKVKTETTFNSEFKCCCYLLLVQLCHSIAAAVVSFSVYQMMCCCIVASAGHSMHHNPAVFTFFCLLVFTILAN